MTTPYPKGIRMGSGGSFTIRNFIVLFHLPNIGRKIKSRSLRWAGHIVRMEDGKNPFKMLTMKPIVGREMERPKHRWQENMKMELKENVKCYPRSSLPTKF